MLQGHVGALRVGERSRHPGHTREFVLAPGLRVQCAMCVSEQGPDATCV